MRRWLVGLAVVVLCGACAAVTLAVRPGGGGGLLRFGRPAPVNLKKAVIDKGDLRSEVTATGSVVAKGQSDLSFDQAGTVVELLVSEGQHVEAGQILARLDDTNEQFNVQQAQFAVQAAQAVLDKLLEPVDPRDVANADANVKAAQAAYSAKAGAVSPDTIKTYQLQYQQAQAAASSADYQRADAGGQYAQDDPNYQKAVAQVGIAQNNAEIARLRLQQITAGSSVLSATANISLAQAKLEQIKAGTKDVDIADAQVQLAIAQLQLAQAQHRLDRIRLIAPFAGTVTTVNAKQGEAISGVVLTLTDDSQFYVDVQVDETDIGKIRLVQSVEMTLDALPGVPLTGTVQRIDQIADTITSVITYPVRVRLDKTAAPIKATMTANAIFIVNNLVNVVRIPNEYIKQNRSTGQTTVNLVNADGTYTEIAVKTGVQGTEYTEVIEGLNEGDTVALVLDTSTPGQ